MHKSAEYMNKIWNLQKGRFVVMNGWQMKWAVPSYMDVTMPFDNQSAIKQETSKIQWKLPQSVYSYLQTLTLFFFISLTY